MERKHDFDPAALSALIENRLSWYYTQTAAEAVSSNRSPYGALIRVSADNGVAFMVAALDHAQRGYVFQDTNFVQLSAGYSYADFLKPQYEQEADIAAITAEVTAEYKKSLKALYDIHLQRIVADTVAMAERAEAKKAEAAKAKLIERATADAIAALGAFPE